MRASLHRSCVVVASQMVMVWGSLGLGCGPVHAKDVPSACADAEKLTRVQRRLLVKAEEGVEPLRQYVYMTRTIYQLDIHDVQNWLDQRRAVKAACAALADSTGKPTASEPTRLQ